MTSHLDLGQPDVVLPAGTAGTATPAVMLPPAVTMVAVGVSGITSAVVRVELGIRGQGGQGVAGVSWFDAGTALDLDASTTTRSIGVAGYAGVRLAVRTAADEQVSVYWSRPR